MINTAHQNRPLQIGVTATTFTGNHGAEAMLTVCIEQVRKRFPESRIHVLTYSPQSDLKWCETKRPKNIWIHSSTPLKILLSWFPLSSILKLLPFLKSKLSERDGQGITTLLDLDMVVDFAGVAFMDGREKFLPFNVLTLYPFLLHKIPVVKLSQAIGPITSPLNKLCARWTLSKLSFIAARGSKTVEHLQNFGLPQHIWSYAPDAAFLLSLEEEMAESTERTQIAFLPSSLMLKTNPDYPQLITETIAELRARGMRVNLLAHSWKEDSDLPRNNDFPLCKKIHEALGSPKDMELYGPGLDARALKRVIAQHRIAVTSRFHGMIAALDSATPAWVLGWSHKYREVLSEFELEPCAIDTKNITSTKLAAIIEKGYEEAPFTTSQLAKHLPRVRNQCAEQFERLFNLLARHD